MAIPEDHLVIPQQMMMKKISWFAIKSRFGRNDDIQQVAEVHLEGQQFEGFTVSNSDGISQRDMRVPKSINQVDEYDLERKDLKWQVAMISMRINKFQKKTGRKLQFDAKEPVGFDKTKVECFKCHKTGYFARECRTKGRGIEEDGWNTGNRRRRKNLQ
ncbi:ribonuclease H-like domain-containing protein [Tanacetum coccineum]